MELEAPWIDSMIEMPEEGEVGYKNGQYPIDIPVNLPKGHRYDIITYRQASSIPANTDTVDDGFVMKYGGMFGF
jgi:hypothetical protein